MNEEILKQFRHEYILLKKSYGYIDYEIKARVNIDGCKRDFDRVNGLLNGMNESEIRRSYENLKKMKPLVDDYSNDIRCFFIDYNILKTIKPDIKEYTLFDIELKLNGIDPLHIIDDLIKAQIIKCPISIEDVLQCKEKLTIKVNDPHEWAWSIIVTLIKFNYSQLNKLKISTPISKIFNYFYIDKTISFIPRKFNEDRDKDIDYTKNVEKYFNFS